ncbi:TRAP transporter substrate-binding protein DctP [Marinobacter salarius]|uniref:TRAP transporter substrate-binding protein DctP n=1 Tax=Marinobacter salarius TaxID=1420917 RepID=UPI00273CE0AE|nr:TRAP transporter substrate-binding protein DctP [Marinobacter salarius]MDP4532884.1 TRAP transporter substrate-binding protein DctP [Marinobacter salarius]
MINKTKAIGLVAALAGTLNIAHAQERQLTMATMAVPGTTVETVSHGFAEKANEALQESGISIVVNDSLLKGAQLSPAVRDGRVDLVLGVHPYISGSEPLMGLQSLPGLIQTQADYQNVLDNFWQEDLAQVWEKNWNAIPLVEGAWSKHVLFTTKPVTSVKDFQGMKIRVHNPETAQFIAGLGARPTPLDASEIAVGLERNLIDGLFTPACYAYHQELWRSVSHIQDWGIGPMQGWAVLINKEVWESLSSEDQETLKRIGQELEETMWQNFAAASDECIDGMRDNGLTVVNADQKQREAIFTPETVDPVVNKWVQRASEKGFDGQAIIEKTRSVTGNELK